MAEHENQTGAASGEVCGSPPSEGTDEYIDYMLEMIPCPRCKPTHYEERWKIEGKEYPIPANPKR